MNLSQLDQYEISQWTAFVPQLPSATSLPPQFRQVEELIVDPPLHEAISSLRLRTKVDGLPLYYWYDFAVLSSTEKKRLLVILTFVAHGYIWGNGLGPPLDTLPKQIALPLSYLSKELGIAPLGTYASTVLWNSRRKDPARGWSLDNVSIDLTFTGTEDESWFYKVSVCVEVAGAQALWSLLSILLEIRQSKPDLGLIQRHFQKAQASFDEMLATLVETRKMNSEVFYWDIRPNFGGWHLILPQGVHYAGVDEASVYRSYVGISAAQSSLFRAFDIIFDISHSEPGATYLRKMHEYMPSPHARFLGDLKANFSGTLRAFITDHEELSDTYNQCLRNLAKFRAVHRGLVQKYAVQEASRPKKRAFGLAKSVTAGGGVQGAGGTPIELFLRSTWEKTEKAMVTKSRL
ncbi:uncharacterized protein Z519_12713 [Cladophialophora bantiana CBS 173.52]|uniref:Indoleamine 2,3-dioxygenase n=1 Tax=Cladophialophora bantiana (strain ATCC 10958 / CBS 173.52 / CDC B-1940 / NIH 8579) TaxID=1442370 RepID=A0A0D2H053_CLAB1|nr:uncharacterized protein Z519_12713 [Cladophialophora bantiana CBS 173.52]KIW86658.1 hypothetical protein Z519_12713 [Cladophialophora bantiana CBS 173.52]